MFTTVPFKSVPGLDRPVTDVMHHGLIALPATATLADVASTMHDHKVHAVLVIGTDGDPLGWVTSAGMLRNHGRDWTVAASAADAVTQPAASVAPTDTLTDAMNVFIATGASHILVGASAAEPPIGVLADSDLVAFIAQ
jgi:signal-transduction protein with cAMP-binding, CBS, and nucleotidyltransferase domain